MRLRPGATGASPNFPTRTSYAVMTKPRHVVAVVVAAVLSVPGVFFAAMAYFDWMVKAEYESGARTSTDGDSIFIPVMGVTVAWTFLLLVVGGVTGVVILVRRARRSAA